MKAVIDGLIEIEQVSLEVGSWQRNSIDRSATGLDGVVSVDAGRRGRKLKQSGLVSANNAEAMSEQISLIQGLVDGAEHVLAVEDDGEFGNVRVDSVKAGNRKMSGRGWSSEVEIRYTQLREV